MENYSELTKFMERLKKIGVNLELCGNYPWIYIDKINSKKVTEKFQANHGFTLGYYPIKLNGDFKFSDLSEIFKIIRNYKKSMGNYKIITDEAALRNFIEFLPNLEDGEGYYVTLLCRNKYTNKLLKDKVQLKRVTSNKEFLFDKIKQMECELGTYKYKGEPIPVESMCLYITPNPRSYEKAAKKLAKHLIDLCFDKYSGYNPQAEALTAIQKSCSRTVFMDFDFDNTTIEEMWSSIVAVVNQDAITFVQTHGGFHVLIEVSKIEDRYKKTYYNGITKLPNVDARGDGIIPVPGCSQGGKTPVLIKNI